MQGYVFDFRKIYSEEFGNLLEVRFNGCNFDCIFCSNIEYKKFSQDFLIDLNEIKKEMQNYDTVIFSGGEPLIQQNAFLELLTYSKKNLKTTILKTNLSKSKFLETCLEKEIIDILLIETFPFFEEKFKKITQVRNYFVKSKEIIYDITYSLFTLKKHTSKHTISINNDLSIYLLLPLIPGLLYSKKEIYEIIDFYTSFIIPKKIILNPISPKILTGRYKLINSLSYDYILNIGKDIFSDYAIPYVIEK